MESNNKRNITNKIQAKKKKKYYRKKLENNNKQTYGKFTLFMIIVLVCFCTMYNHTIYLQTFPVLIHDIHNWNGKCDYMCIMYSCHITQQTLTGGLKQKKIFF